MPAPTSDESCEVQSLVMANKVIPFPRSAVALPEPVIDPQSRIILHIGKQRFAIDISCQATVLNPVSPPVAAPPVNSLGDKDPRRRNREHTARDRVNQARLLRPSRPTGGTMGRRFLSLGRPWMSGRRRICSCMSGASSRRQEPGDPGKGPAASPSGIGRSDGKFWFSHLFWPVDFVP
jgi:hypothetical protein